MLDPQTKTPFSKDTAFGNKVQLATFELGVAVYAGAGTIDGVVGDHVLLAPPYTVTVEELAHTAEMLKKACDTVARVHSGPKI